MVEKNKKYIPVNSSELTIILCYPSADRECFNKRARSLVDYGINYLVSEGRREINRIRVLGKGHSAIVVKALHNKYGEVVLKLRRSDSKRDSLILECRLMELAVPIAPRPYVCDDDFIVMEFIDGMYLEEFIKCAVTSCRDAVLLLVKVLAASYWLDVASIEHKELSIAGRHVMLSKNGSIKIIDYESASPHYRPCNLCSIFSWIVVRKHLLEMFCQVGSEFVGKLVRLVKEYKLSTSREERKKLFERLVRKLHKLMMHHNS